ncbi:MAG: tRNA (cytidine(56)-2'-O)-methyltransferase [Candidatus Altiarchaeota archaeon]|nr:tRNA (cytidine(56)-2'-O)-methyltransferase [Candidatus Altiarchaeota archaeon]
MKISVLRLGHRISRDKRITTHVCLVARALGAEEVVITGEKDESILNSVQEAVSTWGGDFSARWSVGWNSVVKQFKEKGYEIIHLTMYGLPVQDNIEKIRRSGKDKLIIVGGEKVPSEVYQSVDYNISITTQPHSEIAALAIMLDRIFSGKELEKTFSNPKKQVVPQARSKQVLNKTI